MSTSPAGSPQLTPAGARVASPAGREDRISQETSEELSSRPSDVCAPTSPAEPDAMSQQVVDDGGQQQASAGQDLSSSQTIGQPNVTTTTTTTCQQEQTTAALDIGANNAAAAEKLAQQQQQQQQQDMRLQQMQQQQLSYNRPQKYCAVCGDKAIACNFNAVTCESCKAFFRRNAFKESRLRCLFESHCVIDRVTRRFCSKCRLLKCFAIGMKREWILTDEQKQVKRVKILQNRAARTDHRPLATMSGDHSGGGGSRRGGSEPSEGGNSDTLAQRPSPSGSLASSLGCDYAHQQQSVQHDALRTPVAVAATTTSTTPPLLGNPHRQHPKKRPFAEHADPAVEPAKRDVGTNCPDELDLRGSGHLLACCTLAGQCHFCALRLNSEAPSHLTAASGSYELGGAPQRATYGQQNQHHHHHPPHLITANNHHQLQHHHHHQPHHHHTAPAPGYYGAHQTTTSSPTGNYYVPSPVIVHHGGGPAPVPPPPPQPAQYHTAAGVTPPTPTCCPLTPGGWLPHQSPVRQVLEQAAPVTATGDPTAQLQALETPPPTAQQQLPPVTTCPSARRDTSGRPRVRLGPPDPAESASLRLRAHVEQVVAADKARADNERPPQDSPGRRVSASASEQQCIAAIGESASLEGGGGSSPAQSAATAAADEPPASMWRGEAYCAPAASDLEVRTRLERLDFSDSERQLINEMLEATRLVFEPQDRMQNETILDDIVFFCDAALRRLIKTVKQIAAFRLLSMDDQIVLLKNACFKILLLRSSFHYQDDIEGWRDKWGRVCALKSLKTEKCYNYERHKAIMDKLAVPMRKDRLLMAFMILIILFDPTVQLKHSNSVALDNMVYLCALRKYLVGTQPDPLAKYERIVETLQVINACNEEYNLFFSRNYQPEEITPLLIEIFDISINDPM